MHKLPAPKVYKLIMAALIAITAQGRARAMPDSPTVGQQVAREFTTTLSRRVGYKYLLFLPRGYGQDTTAKWPTILFLHGSGERGTRLAKVAANGPPKIAASNPDFPFVVVSPQCRDDENWDPEAVIALLDHVLATERIDRTRVYLTGLSLGGYGAWKIAGLYPEYFAAVAPVCGGGSSIEPYLLVGTKKHALDSLGVWAFHGAKDPRVPLAESQRMVAVYKEAGVRDIQLTVYPEAGHDSWTMTYDNPELYKWFLRHQRSPD